MKHSIEHNVGVIRELHNRVHTTCRGRSKNPEAYRDWQQACEEFHASYDQLAFPGGLSKGLDLLKAGDMTTAETAILFLELHPYFFRSQYIATSLTRLLKKVQLGSDLRERFDIVLLATRERKCAKGHTQ